MPGIAAAPRESAGSVSGTSAGSVSGRVSASAVSVEGPSLVASRCDGSTSPLLSPMSSVVGVSGLTRPASRGRWDLHYLFTRLDIDRTTRLQLRPGCDNPTLNGAESDCSAIRSMTSHH